MRSLADLDTDKLSPDARSALSVTQRVENDGESLTAVLAELGIDEEEHARRVQLLAHEWVVQGGPTTIPPLAAEEYSSLRDSIAESGQKYPILRAPDHDGWIVDGEHRERACLELGIEPRYEDVFGTRDELQSLALVVNLARRQLTAGARRGIVKSELLRDPARSDRAIAATVGVSPSTVGSVRRELEHDERLSKLDSRLSQDGRERPATQPAREPKPPAAPSPDVVDVTLRIVPEIVEAAFAGDAWVECNAIRLHLLEPGVYELQVRT